MRSDRAFTLTELCVVAVSGVVLAAGTQLAQTPAQLRARSLDNLRSIGAAAAVYRTDNQGYLPLEGIKGNRRFRTGTTVSGWCTWSHAGKNNDRWWYSGTSSMFDVEAADRPLNAYLYPGVVFEAPAPPARLGPDAPGRQQQAPLNRDPADNWSVERAWPTRTKTVSTYQDVGTSYLWNAVWWEQEIPGGTSFEGRIQEATGRLAAEKGAPPARFVWMIDPFVGIVVNRPDAGARIVNWYGDVNRSLMLYLDGYAAYQPTFPGRRRTAYINEHYSLIFEDLPPLGFP